MPTPPSREESLFEQCLALSASERQALLDHACMGQPELRQAVEELLAAHELDDQRFDTAALTLPRIGLGDSSTEEAVLGVAGPRAGDWIGRYRLLEQIGEGGCGIVYLAEQREPVQRRVALKVLKPGMDTKSVVARFEAERQALALMDHPNIARVLDGGATSAGHPYFVMELVRGSPITEYCDRESLSPKQRIDLFIQVCGAVQHAHQKGIIHRDLKPSNVLVAVLDGQPIPKVIDFGIAKATQGRLTDQTLFTAFHQFMGTPAYMSPEQAGLDGTDVDTRSDIYSLGVLLYELLTGSPPFDPKDLLSSGFDAMRRRIREEEPPRPSKRLSTLVGAQIDRTAKSRSLAPPRLIRVVRGDLDWIVMKCLEKDRNRRYLTTNGLATDLTRHLAMDPVSARPPSAWYLCVRMVRRHRLAFAAALAVVISLILGILAAMAQARRAEHARAETARALEKLERESLRGAELFKMSQDWRSLTYGLAHRIDKTTLSNLANEFETRFVNTSGPPMRRLLWKVNLAFVRSWSGHGARAEELLRQATREMEREFGPAAPDTRFARMYLADFLVSEARTGPDLEALIQTNLIASEAAVPPDWTAIAYARKDLAALAKTRGDAEAVVEHARHFQVAVSKAFGFQTYGLSYHRVVVAGYLFDVGKTNEAIAMLRERLDQEVTFGEMLNGQLVFMTRVVLVRQLMRASRFDDAESVLNDGLVRYTNAEPGILAELRRERRELYLRSGREARALEDALSASRVDRGTFDDWQDATLMLLHAGQRVDYEKQCREGLERFTGSLSSVDKERLAAVVVLGSTNRSLVDQAAALAGPATRDGADGEPSTAALIRYRQERFDEALTLARSVPFENPRDLRQVAARFTIALAETRLGRHEAAREAYQAGYGAWQKVRSHPSDCWLREWMAIEILDAEARALMESTLATESRRP
ncbi:MAG: protein kinase [Verrucomicrobiales bacterium]|nr:protein kinase [Verrucomicrobiales bacterium]